jgi:hypothetical protein
MVIFRMAERNQTHEVKNNVFVRHCSCVTITNGEEELSHHVTLIRVDGWPVVTLDDSQLLLHGKNNHENTCITSQRLLGGIPRHTYISGRISDLCQKGGSQSTLPVSLGGTWIYYLYEYSTPPALPTKIHELRSDCVALGQASERASK